jgi:hypothetical protein
MQINKRQLKKWIAALDSNEYGPKRRRFYGRHLFQFDWPLEQRWLNDLNQDFADKAGGVTISYLFHHLDYTFVEIATLLELVYIHKILD